MPVITPSGTTRCQAITDIIESVALQEAALAHILNAEGEKLQNAVNREAVTPSQLLEFNKSVEQTIRSVAQLEVILQSKLSLFDNCLCSCTSTPSDN
ncbi:MAG: hypothetical protein ACOX81_08505 [Candidatus Heteroscillospira sp.]